MAKEDKSVRQLVQNIDKRTSDLAPVLDNLSDSLNKITKAFSPRKEENDSPKKDKRAALLEKFAPKVDPTEQLIEETDQNELVLREIKEAIEKNHKESFKVFQNMENFLKVIAVEGAAGGGGVGGLLEGLDIGGKDKGGKPGKGPAGAAKSGGGFLKNAARFASKAALPLAAGMAAFDAVGGYQKASENLGIEGREATFGEKLSSGAGSAISGLTFGLLDEKAASRGIASFFGAGPPKTPEEAANQSEMLDLAAQAEGGIPTETNKEIKAVAPAPPVAPTVTPPAAPKVEAKPTPVTPPAAPKVEAKPKAAPSKPTFSTVEKKENPEVKKLQEEFFSLGKDLKKLNEDFTIPKEEKKKKRNEIVSKATAITEKLEKIEPGSGDLGGLGAFEDREQFKSTIEAHKQEDLKAEAMLASGDYEKNDEGAVVKKSSAKPTTPLVPKESITTTTTVKQSITSGETKTAKASAAQQKILGLDDEYNKKTAEVRAKLIKEGKIEDGEILTEDMFQSVPELKALREEKAVKKSELEKGVLAGTSESITPSTSVSSQTVSNLTNENKDLMENLHNQAVQPVIITNNNSTSSNQQTVSPIRTSPRPSNNSFERKQNQVSSY